MCVAIYLVSGKIDQQEWRKESLFIEIKSSSSKSSSKSYLSLVAEEWREQLVSDEQEQRWQKRGFRSF